MEMDYDYSPALSASSDFSDMTDEELDKYFASYVPLSNLPTPPPAKEIPHVGPVILASFPAVSSTKAGNQAHQSPELEVYATHLSNLVPNNVAPQQPLVQTIHGFLERAQLPPEMVAFACCILDALSQRFASSWRTACQPPLTLSFAVNGCLRHLGPGPEVVVLSALSLAHGFIDDRGRSNGHWARVVGHSLFSIRDIDVTKRYILEDMDYGLFRITQEMVQHMTKDMQRAGNFTTSTTPTLRGAKVTMEQDDPRPKRSIDLQGTAMWKNGVQTPEPSP